VKKVTICSTIKNGLNGDGMGWKKVVLCALYSKYENILLTALLRVGNKLRYAYMNNHDLFTEEYFTLKAFKWGWQPVYELPPILWIECISLMNMGRCEWLSTRFKGCRFNNCRSKSVYFPFNCQKAPEPLLVCVDVFFRGCLTFAFCNA